jgi:molecular chaperone GrpE (heat shock protein)
MKNTHEEEFGKENTDNYGKSANLWLEEQYLTEQENLARIEYLENQIINFQTQIKNVKEQISISKKQTNAYIDYLIKNKYFCFSKYLLWRNG